MTLFTFRLPFLQIILFIYACRTVCELFWKSSSYVSGLTFCIFVAVALYARMFVAGANKVEGTMSWCVGTNEI